MTARFSSCLIVRINYGWPGLAWPQLLGFFAGPGEMEASEGSSKKLRKPYTITKSRDRWSEEEHERFLDALLMFGRDWKKIEDFVGTKTVIQIRSHAQKYFQKAQASGMMAHVPPPRPKRKAAHPHHQKISDSDMGPIQGSIICSSTSSSLLPACTTWDDTPMHMDYTSDAAMYTSDYYPVLPDVKGDAGFAGVARFNYRNTYSTGNSSRQLQTYEVPKQGNSNASYPVIPDFVEVYHFIASMFDPYVKCPLGEFLQKLKEMDPITAKTVLLLVKNLTINMSSPGFESLWVSHHFRWPWLEISLIGLKSSGM